MLTITYHYVYKKQNLKLSIPILVTNKLILLAWRSINKLRPISWMNFDWFTRASLEFPDQQILLLPDYQPIFRPFILTGRSQFNLSQLTARPQWGPLRRHAFWVSTAKLNLNSFNFETAVYSLTRRCSQLVSRPSHRTWLAAAEMPVIDGSFSRPLKQVSVTVC